MKRLLAVLFLTVSFFPFNLYAQSGRKTLSDKTGGRFYDGDSMFGIAQAFTWIAEELGRQYSIGYYPLKPGQNGERREIKVKVTEADLVVKARDSYIYSDKGRRLTQMLTRMNP